jgi:hypothetical protein
VLISLSAIMVNLSMLSVIIFNFVPCFQEIQYDIVVNKIVQSVTNKSILDHSKLKLSKFNRTTQILSGPFEAYIDLDNSVGISISGFRRAGNEWRTIPFRVPLTPYCDYAKNEKFYFELFYQHAGLPSKDHCPAIPKVGYTWNQVNFFLIIGFV